MGKAFAFVAGIIAAMIFVMALSGLISETTGMISGRIYTEPAIVGYVVIGGLWLILPIMTAVSVVLIGAIWRLK